MSKLAQLYPLIRDWAEARNLIEGSDMKSQFMKLDSENGELSGNTVELYSPQIEQTAEELTAKLKDDVGDNIVVLTILAAQADMKIEELIDMDTTDSTGNTFVEVLRYQQAKGRLADAILKGDTTNIAAFIAVCVHLLMGVAIALEVEFEECVQAAYDDIKDRKGVMYHGAFVKSTDARYADICLELGVQP